MNNIFECHELGFSYAEGKSKTDVLNNIDFRLLQGESVALLGKSGSGKSTLLRMISGLANPSSSIE